MLLTGNLPVNIQVQKGVHAVGAKLVAAQLKAEAAEKSEKAEMVCKPRVRDKIFETACDLFYQHGIRAVGVDAIAQGAGTNKMSFYRRFPSKEDMVAEK